MALPSLYSLSAGRSMLQAFGGLNESYACAEAEFTAMENFSSRGYPALQTRTPRRVLRKVDRCNGMYHLNGLLTCEGTCATAKTETGRQPRRRKAGRSCWKMRWPTARRS